MGYVTILDNNLYKKKQRALAKYFRGAYKYLIFQAVPKLKEPGKIDGLYQVELPVDDLFVKVYGKLILKFSVKKDIAMIEDIEPNDILIACYEKDLPLYKGIPYDSEKDLKKIKIMEALCEK
jgi:hypothetical protein